MCYHWNRCKASNRWRRQARIRTPPYTHKNRQIRVADLLYQMAHGNILLCISLCLIYNNYYGKGNQPEYKWRPRPYNVLSNVYVDHNLYYLSSSQLYIYIGLIACAYKIVVYLPNIMVHAFSINLKKKQFIFWFYAQGCILRQYCEIRVTQLIIYCIIIEEVCRSSKLEIWQILASAGIVLALVPIDIMAHLSSMAKRCAFS